MFHTECEEISSYLIEQCVLRAQSIILALIIQFGVIRNILLLICSATVIKKDATLVTSIGSPLVFYGNIC